MAKKNFNKIKEKTSIKVDYNGIRLKHLCKEIDCPDCLFKLVKSREQQTKKDVSLKVKKQMINEFPFHKDLKRFLGIVSDECGFYSDKELKESKKNGKRKK